MGRDQEASNCRASQGGRGANSTSPETKAGQGHLLVYQEDWHQVLPPLRQLVEEDKYHHGAGACHSCYFLKVPQDQTDINLLLALQVLFLVGVLWRWKCIEDESGGHKIDECKQQPHAEQV